MRGVRFISVSLIGAALLAGPAWSQDQTTVVAPLESRRTMVPVPKVGEGAPYYSSEQLESERKRAMHNIGCIGNAARRRSFSPGAGRGGGWGYDGSWGVTGLRGLQRANNYGFDVQAKETRVANHAKKAMNATIAAEETRKRAAQGLATVAEVELTELKRQEAVRYYDFLLERNFGLGYDASVGLDYPVEIEVVSATIREENGREWLYVTGRIQNLRNGSLRIPTVTLAVYDLDGNLTMATAAQPSTNTLKTGEARPFGLRVPAWKDAARVEVKAGMLAPFQGDRDFCRPRAGVDALTAAREYEILQDDLLFNRPPGGHSLHNSAPIQRGR